MNATAHRAQPDASPADTALLWMISARQEIELAERNWQAGDRGKGRVGSRRAAGMALKARLSLAPDARYGRAYIQHINALADDERAPAAQREMAWRLAARPIPAEGFLRAIEGGLTPLMDAQGLMDWVLSELRADERMQAAQAAEVEARSD